MVGVECIKKHHEDGWSIRKIVRRFEMSRQTVRKMLGAPAEPPRYRQRAPRPTPVMGPYLSVVESMRPNWAGIRTVRRSSRGANPGSIIDMMGLAARNAQSLRISDAEARGVA